MKQQYPATLTGRACIVNKGFVYMAFRKFFLWDTYSGVVLSGQDSAIFPAGLPIVLQDLVDHAGSWS